MKKWISLLLCVVMLLGMSSIAETTITEIADDTVVATLNGKDILWNEISASYDELISLYGASYDLTQQLNIDLFRAVALEDIVISSLILAQAEKLGFAPLSTEEVTAIEEQNKTMLDSAIADYIASMPTTDENGKAIEVNEETAKAEAITYFESMGYTLDALNEDAKNNVIIEKVFTNVVSDVTVTPEEVENNYQATVERDRIQFENNLQNYSQYVDYVNQNNMYAQMGMGEYLSLPTYVPAGIRNVKHILLPVDETLLATYVDLNARYEEQMSAEVTAPTQETTEEKATEEVATPVTEEEINAAKAAILESVKAKTEEINQKLTEGMTFEEAITTYGVNADGTPSDPGMTTEPFATTGYEVSEFTTSYVKGFLDASMSLNEIGDVSAPYVSEFGVHIVKYISDREAGPIPLSDEERNVLSQSILFEKQNVVFEKYLADLKTSSDLVLTGVIPSTNDAIAAQNSAAATAIEPASEATTEPTK